MQGNKRKSLLRVAALAGVAFGASACSSMPSVPDWVDPTNWFGSSTPEPVDNGKTPDLASIPDKPATSSPDDRAKVADKLAEDRSHAQYSADALRGGTQAAAPPPPNIAPVTSAESLPGSAEDNARKTHATTPPEPAKPQQSAPTPPVETAQSVDRSVTEAPAGTSSPGVLPPPPPLPQGATPEAAPSAEPAPAMPQERPAQANQAEAAPPPGAQPAVPPEPAASSEPVAQPKVATRSRARQSTEPSEPATSPENAAQPKVAQRPRTRRRPVAEQQAPEPSLQPPQQTASAAPADAAMGFKPSSAPPLDPSAARYVPPAILRQYRETSGTGGTRAAVESAAGGAVEVVMFPHDAVRLNAAGRAKVRQAVRQYMARGGEGFVRVVGHSSSRTPNMSVERHMALVFRKSQARAVAVAQELIREGVPANKVLVDAVGDRQPVYYESMPKGDDGNRRAEIFLQG